MTPVNGYLQKTKRAGAMPARPWKTRFAVSGYGLISTPVTALVMTNFSG